MDGRLARADLAVLGVAMLAVSTSGPMIAALTAPALAIAFWRNAMGAAAIGATALARPSVRAEFAALTGREIKLIVAAGLLLSAHFMCWTPSLSYTTVASATALVCVQPVWAALGSRLLGRPVSRLTWMGIGLSLAGVLLLTSADLSVSGRAVWGDLLAIVGGMLAAAYTTIGEEVRRSVSTTVYTSFCYGTCALATLVVCLAAGIRMFGYDGETWLRLVALTVCAQLLGHTLFNRVVGRVGATVVSTAILLEVPMAALIAAIFLDQAPPGTAVPAGVLLLAGVYVVVRAEGRAREEQQANLPVD
ncbi:DMT family transporter [Sporichthya sp.]|uniref:DMT family transporter n=1 Tax=Sporichthya sp. TaxID=65475 RepID=UPI0017AE0D30|nr:DMT family transporter [Sporichthya sp.]MBA3743036.1 DMT family transporter [Sporichthya sp.]